jgi:two-component system sensor histidine kinase KdpD
MKNKTQNSNTRVSILSKLSHELKTPIHGIRGISTHLHDNLDVLHDSEKLRCLSAVIEASESLSNILDSMLVNISNKEEINFKFEETDLVDLTRVAVEKCKNLYLNKKEVNITFASEEKTCISVSDSFWIIQLVTNLLSNAINYTDHGNIRVVLRKEKSGKNRPHCVISVQDEGVGIAKTDLEKIFDPYKHGSTTDEMVKSTGLGLTICREIVEAHGGNIYAKNNFPDKGSTIEFNLPLQS